MIVAVSPTDQLCSDGREADCSLPRARLLPIYPPTNHTGVVGGPVVPYPELYAGGVVGRPIVPCLEYDCCRCVAVVGKSFVPYLAGCSCC